VLSGSDSSATNQAFMAELDRPFVSAGVPKFVSNDDADPRRQRQSGEPGPQKIVRPERIPLSEFEVVHPRPDKKRAWWRRGPRAQRSGGRWRGQLRRTSPEAIPSLDRSSHDSFARSYSVSRRPHSAVVLGFRGR